MYITTTPPKRCRYMYKYDPVPSEALFTQQETHVFVYEYTSILIHPNRIEFIINCLQTAVVNMFFPESSTHTLKADPGPTRKYFDFSQHTVFTICILFTTLLTKT